jgi:hypothetical protein
MLNMVDLNANIFEMGWRFWGYNILLLAVFRGFWALLGFRDIWAGLAFFADFFCFWRCRKDSSLIAVCGIDAFFRFQFFKFLTLVFRAHHSFSFWILWP